LLRPKGKDWTPHQRKTHCYILQLYLPIITGITSGSFTVAI